jgi:hypothetical protein
MTKARRQSRRANKAIQKSPLPPGNHDHARMDRSKLRGREGHCACPCTKPAMRPESRDALLTAIAKARGWIDDIRLGRIASFAGIAEREAQGERHIRLVAPLACRTASLRRSSMAPRVRTSRSRASPRRCPIRGPSRRRGLDSRCSTGDYCRCHDRADAIACSKHGIKSHRLAAGTRNPLHIV